MGFFDLFRKGKLFAGQSKPPTMVVAFFFRGRKYILEEFDLEFNQDIDNRNRPDSDVKGGLITLTISETPDSDLTTWMINSLERRDGELRFFANEEKIDQGSLLDIIFKDAYCISYQKILNPKGSGALTTLIISPHKLQIGQEVYESSWHF